MHPIKDLKETKKNIVDGYNKLSDDATKKGLEMGKRRIEERDNGSEPTADSAIDNLKEAYNKTRELPLWKLIFYIIIFVFVLVIVLIGIIFK
ncbi:hypothetical protein DY052_06045 [Apilactobacillus timberlakei]|uniref:hypothetical protein n=1 Tax=Apilactobacillus timberlakei TaxID=2008380 RepID=UPI0011271916|nr:hypothetical protein [Apilactobacillus timberlakei]TPR14985.1 hypothetical protein DY052_06045 [Apilactobacillus timberlakei]